MAFEKNLLSAVAKWPLCVICIMLVSSGKAYVKYPQYPSQGEEHYSTISINGKKVGYRATRISTADGISNTETLEVIYINRAGVLLQVMTLESYQESQDGHPISFTRITNMSGSPIRYEGRVVDGKLKVRITQNEKQNDACYKWDPNTLFPQAFRRLQLQKGFSLGTRYTALQYFPGMDIRRPIQVTSTVVGPEQIYLNGRNRSVVKVERKITGLEAYPQYEWVDRSGNSLRALTRVNGMEISTAPCSRTEALSIDFLSLPQVFAKTVIPAPEEFRQRSSMKSVILEVPMLDGIKRSRVPESASQKVWVQENSFIIQLSRSVEPSDSRIVLDETSSYRKPNVFLDWDDPQIAKLLDMARVADHEPWSKAKLLTDFVRRSIKKKDLSVGIATASEIAKRLEGDCTEHAILLGALLRATGLPSRVVCGLQHAHQYGYESNVWRWHMWTQVNIAGQWYDLDSSMDQCKPGLDRIGLSYSSLDEGDDLFVLTFPLMALMGENNIRVVSEEYAN